MTDLIRDRLLKVKELAETGIDGEKQSAIKLLRELLEKYNLTFDDLIDKEIERYDFSYTMSAEEILLFGVVRKVTGWGDISYYKVPGTRIAAFGLTHVQATEIQFLYSYYRKPFKKWIKEKIKAASYAFCRKNMLCLTITSENKNTIDDPLTDEEMELLRKIWREEEDIKALPKPNQGLIDVK
ncbi:MAG TPA: hypothetical protein ENH82_04895 [bacterium]|nr:hypothetical protein [bacterium]